MKRGDGKKGKSRGPGGPRAPREHPGATETGEHAEMAARRADELSALKDKAGKADEYYESLLRLKAEFENFRKRTGKEMAESRRLANQDLILELLPAIDSFELGLESAQKTRDFDKLIEGLELALNNFLQVLGKFGLNRIEAEGTKFNPNYHDAVMTTESDEHEDDTVVDEIRRGYLLHNKLLRPAMVSVARSVNRSSSEAVEAGEALDKKDGAQR